MQQVTVSAFGGTENLQVKTVNPVQPKSTEVVIQLTSVGLNQADLMARRGEYRLSSGAPPFTPGIEGGGVITAVGSQVVNRQVGQRVILTIAAPHKVGTYRSQFVTAARNTVVVPDGIPDDLIGALWLAFATAWGALVWRQKIQPGQTLMLPAASSSVAISASQIAKSAGAIVIGTTTSPEKVDALQHISAAKYDHIVVTSANTATGKAEPWWRQIKKITGGKGVDVIFDPVAAGDFLHHEIRLLAKGGTLWVYGLLGTPDTVDVSPLIRKDAAIRGWLLNALVDTPAEQAAYQHILKNVAAGVYQLPIATTFSLDRVREAHEAMEIGSHIGKYVLMPALSSD
ncbi:MAG: oxidoreductase [Leptolyngbya foveolarum]|uniref:Oxidoreductase n=1 Tax=Leptolyngbya foveolarum TaxID=47253 RepID=A0A2W4U342_9CYAN|nr:MAG: oxidoreductase [Leptolyngbya foveolarum]